MRCSDTKQSSVLVTQVNIQVPAPELQSDIITITGLATNLDRAKAGLLERVKELQAEQEDRVRPVPVLLSCSQTRLWPLGASFRSCTDSWNCSPFESTLSCSVGVELPKWNLFYMN